MTLKSLIKLIFCTFALLPTVNVSAQVGVGYADSMAIAILSQRNGCASMYPQMRANLDDGLEKMIQANLASYTRKTWLKLSAEDMRFPIIPTLSEEQCIQLAEVLPTFDWTMVAEGHEMLCQDLLRTLAFRSGSRSMIGIQIEESAKGARISKVKEGSPASIAGLRVGDVITEVGDYATPTPCQLIVVIADAKSGVDVEVTVVRDGSQKLIRLVPIAKPADR